MSKKLLILLLITGMVLTLGCAGSDQGTGTTQPTATPSAGATSVVTPMAETGPAGANLTTADNESTPELDLPLPPDLTDL